MKTRAQIANATRNEAAVILTAVNVDDGALGVSYATPSPSSIEQTVEDVLANFDERSAQKLAVTSKDSGPSSSSIALACQERGSHRGFRKGDVVLRRPCDEQHLAALPSSTLNSSSGHALVLCGICEKQICSLTGSALPELSPMRRPLHITLRGCDESPKRQNTLMKELVAGASHALVQRGFSSVSGGIQIVADMSTEDKVRRAATDLLFPCVWSARGFFLLFDEYVGTPPTDVTM